MQASVFYAKCYTLPCDFLRIKRFLKELVLYAMLRFAYNSILKGTRCATNCLKMHFVSIFAASAEVFIRCAVILAPHFFNLRIKIVLKRTRQSKIIRCLVILLTRIFILRIIQFLKELDVQ